MQAGSADWATRYKQQVERLLQTVVMGAAHLQPGSSYQLASVQELLKTQSQWSLWNQTPSALPHLISLGQE